MKGGPRFSAVSVIGACILCSPSKPCNRKLADPSDSLGTRLLRVFRNASFLPAFVCNRLGALMCRKAGPSLAHRLSLLVCL